MLTMHANLWDRRPAWANGGGQNKRARTEVRAKSNRFAKKPVATGRSATPAVGSGVASFDQELW